MEFETVAAVTARKRSEAGRVEGPDPFVPTRDASLPMALLRAREAVMGRFRPLLRTHDVTEQQWRVLRAMAAVGEAEITQLAEMVFLLPPSLSRILKELTGRRLLARRVSKTDARRSLVTLTDEGRALIERIAPQCERIHAEIERLYGREALDDLCATLARLDRMLAGGRR